MACGAGGDTGGDSRATPLLTLRRRYLGDFQPLPTGDAVCDYWLARLPEGERRILEVPIDQHPEPVDRDALEAATGYKRSTRDTYVQRLSARKLVGTSGRGVVLASGTLFG